MARTYTNKVLHKIRDLATRSGTLGSKFILTSFGSTGTTGIP